MLSAGRAHQQVRHVWTALPWAGQTGSSYQDASCSSSLNASVPDVREESVPSPLASTRGFSEAALSSGGSEMRVRSLAHCWASSVCSSSSRRTSSLGLRRGTWYGGITSVLLSPAAAVTSAVNICAVEHAASPVFGQRYYHPWYYGSKLRNRTIMSTLSLDELSSMLRHEGSKLDHINLTAFLQQLERAAAAEAASASAASAPSTPAAAASLAEPSASAGAAAAAAGGSQAVVASAAAKAVERRAVQIAAEAAELVRRRAKWYDPRYAALVVSRTAALGHTDGLLLHEMTGRVVARLNEAYSRDLLLLLRGLHAHSKAAPASASAPPLAAPASPSASSAGERTKTNRRGFRRTSLLPYSGPPEVLLQGVRAFLLGRLPTGRMPPENLDGLLRYLRALSGGRPLGRELCGAAAEDLTRRLPIYAPGALAGLLSTLAAERHPLPAPLLDAAADHFAATAEPYGTGAAAARFLAAAATLLPLPAGAVSEQAGEQQQPQGVVVSEWLGSRRELLAASLRLMTRDLPDTPPERLAAWMQALAHIQAPLAALASSSSTAVAAAPSDAAAAAAAAASFVRAHAAAVERSLPGLQAHAQAVGRMKSAYDAVGLPYPKGL